MSANDTRRISALADSDFTARQTRRQTSRRSLLKASGATAIAAVAGTLGWPKPDVAAAQ